MSEGGSLINLGDISKPVAILVEKVCNAVGIIYEPTGIRRKAHAEADAEKIKALAQIELKDIERRALERMVQQEARKQNNIEQITAQAAALLPETANVQALDEDWIAHFFKQCDTVSDKEMQSLWAKLLSGEATAPGKFSKRTIDLVSSLDKKDAELFTKLCQFAWVIGDLVPLVYDVRDDIYRVQGIDFGTLVHLDAIGLVAFNASGSYQRERLHQKLETYYYGFRTLVEFQSENNNKIGTGKLLFTSVGRELAPICGAVRNEKFYLYVIERWVKEGLVLSSILPSTKAP